MPHPLQGTCFNCGEPIDTAPVCGDEYALYTGEGEFFSPQGLMPRRSVVKRLVCLARGEFASSHPIRFPSALAER